MSEGAQIDGVVLENGQLSYNVTKARLVIGVKFDDGVTAEFTEDIQDFFEPAAHGLKGLAGNLTGDNVIPLSFIPGSTIPVRYDPAARSKLAIDVPALHERALERWMKGQKASRAQAEAVLAQRPAAHPTAAHRDGGKPPRPSPTPQAAPSGGHDGTHADDALAKLEDRHRHGDISAAGYEAGETQDTRVRSRRSEPFFRLIAKITLMPVMTAGSTSGRRRVRAGRPPPACWRAATSRATVL
ncbi:MAG: hypothetical protein ACLP01_10465 [Solirubrobacteraceae bacterium]